MLLIRKVSTFRRSQIQDELIWGYPGRTAGFLHGARYKLEFCYGHRKF